MQLEYEDFQKILKVGIKLTTEKDRNRILYFILKNGMEITNCDAGTLYLCEGDALTFKIMKTFSMGISRGIDGGITFPLSSSALISCSTPSNSFSLFSNGITSWDWV